MSEADNIIKAPPVIGTPESDADFFPGQQERQDSCAIRCQEMVLREFGLVNTDEESLVQKAMIEGWYAPGEGTKPGDVGNILEMHGLAVNRYEEATPLHLAAELAQGHKVIIGVDSYQLWGETDNLLHGALSDLGFTAADHAVIVTGIDTSIPGETRIVISDPGTGEAAASYPINEFMQAWSGSNFYMVATADSVPKDNPAMVNFDYEHGLGEKFEFMADGKEELLLEPNDTDKFDVHVNELSDFDVDFIAHGAFEDDFAEIETGLELTDTVNDDISADSEDFFDGDITEE